MMNEGSTNCNENIKVFLRIRPLLGREVGERPITTVTPDLTTIHISTDTQNVKAKFDRVFDVDTTQEEIFSQMSFAAESTVSGLNSTIFAYGQTGSGKSFTMFGPENDLSIYGSEVTPTMGIIPRSIDMLFKRVEEEKKRNKKALKKGKAVEKEEFSIFCSFMQVYNDQPYDLLRDPNRIRPLKIHENTHNKEIYVVGLSEYEVSSLDECMAIVEQGDEFRACRRTEMNDVSSRSHSIFQMVVERKKVNSGKMIRSKMNLVDLAGSERWGSLDSNAKVHISELTNINTSLHILSRCIAALASKEPNKYVPFRDSRLTRILQDSLGGNARTCVIATLSPAERYVEETIMTLKFADSARQVMQHAHVVETREINLELVERLEAEIERLKGLLTNNGVELALINQASAAIQDADDNHSKELQMEIEKLRKENEELRRQNAQKMAAAEHATSSSSSASPEIENYESWKRAVKGMTTCASKFFSFEIEEDEFRDQFEHYAQFLSLEDGGKGISKNPSRSSASRGRSGGAGLLPSSPKKTQQIKQVSSALKETQKNLEKNRKLQEWLASKAQREMDKIELPDKRPSSPTHSSKSGKNTTLIALGDDEFEHKESPRGLVLPAIKKTN